MKLTHCIHLVAASALCLGLLGSCDILKKSNTASTEGRVVKLADGRTVVVSGVKDPSQPLTPPKAKKEKPKKEKATKGKKAQKTEAAGKPLRESVAAPAKTDTILICNDDKHDHTSPANTAAAEVLGNKTDDFSINGEWTIYSVRGTLVSGEERPYITFDLPAGRFYGNNGCNIINGDVKVGVSGALLLENVISTMKMCRDDQMQYLINLALNDVRSMTVRQEKPLTFLDLKDNSGATILVLRRHNMDFLNGAWKVTALNGTPLVQDDDATMTFDTTDLKIHGTTGCNIFNGDLFIDPDKTDSLQILHLATTKMMCAPDSRETEFLLSLEEVETARLNPDGTVTLSSTDDTALFTLTPLDLRSE